MYKNVHVSNDEIANIVTSELCFFMNGRIQDYLTLDPNKALLQEPDVTIKDLLQEPDVTIKDLWFESLTYRLSNVMPKEEARKLAYECDIERWMTTPDEKDIEDILID